MTLGKKVKYQLVGLIQNLDSFQSSGSEYENIYKLNM